MSNAMVYVGIAIGVIGIGAAITYGTANQANYIPEDAVLQSQAEEGLLPKTSSFGADLNKEQWHEDPFGDEAAAVRAAFESGG